MSGAPPDKQPQPQIDLYTQSSELQPHQNELQQLGELAGIYMDNRIFSILVQLINMGVAPNTIYQVLRSIKRSHTGRAKRIPPPLLGEVEGKPTS